MVTKYSIKTYLKGLERKALASIREQYDAKEDALPGQIIVREKLAETLAKVAQLGLLYGDGVRILEIELMEKATAVNADVERTRDYGYQQTLGYYVLGYNGNMASYQSQMQKAFVRHYFYGEFEKLRQEKNDKLNKTSAAYDEVWNKIKNKKSIPNILEYLRGLGFNIKELEEQGVPEAEASPKLSKDVLFPCLVGKEGEKGNVAKPKSKKAKKTTVAAK